MLRYLERTGLVVPRRTASGYRAYGLLELNQLRSLARLRRHFKVELTDVAFDQPRVLAQRAGQFGQLDSRSSGMPVSLQAEMDIQLESSIGQ